MVHLDVILLKLLSSRLISVSLLNISIKILNSFLHDDLYLSPYHFNSFYKNNYNLIEIFNVCLKSSNTWLYNLRILSCLIDLMIYAFSITFLIFMKIYVPDVRS